VGRSVRRIAVLVVAATLLVQALGAGVVAQSTDGSTMDPADEIYVDEGGDAVLVYESPPDEEGPDSAEFGVNVAENLAYLLVTDSVEEPPDVRGHLTLGATPNAVRGEGDLSVPQPEALEAFSLDASGEATEENSRSDLAFGATVRDDSGATGLLKEASTSGEVTTSADSLSATGDLRVRANVPMGERQALDATLAEDEGGYDLTVDWSRPVSEFVADRWADREAAEQRLRQQFQGVARSLGGSATVDVEEVSVTESGSGYRLHQAYAVRLSGIDEGLAAMVRQALADDPDLSSDQVDRLADGLADVEVEEASLSYELDGRDLTGEFTLDLANYDALALSYFELAQAVDAGAGGFGADVDRLRDRFEAQQAAGMSRTFTWAGDLTHPESGLVRAEFEAHSETENWAAYVDELRERDVPFAETTHELTGGIEDDRVQLRGQASMEGQAVFEQFQRGLPEGDGMPPQATAILQAVRESNPEKAKLNAAYDEDGLRIEAGAAFGNLAALRDALAEESALPSVTEAVGRANETGGQVVVRVDGAVDGQPTGDAVRALPYVDADTTVHLPGEWDREFPTMDTDRAESFLSDVLPSTGSSGPGFGPLVAVAVIVAAAGLLLRRRH
jgi:PGF-CTERM protein